MVKKVAKKKNQKVGQGTCGTYGSAVVKEELLVSEVKTEQFSFGEPEVKKVFTINKYRTSPCFVSRFQPKLESQLI
jgi:hypothetical protein